MRIETDARGARRVAAGPFGAQSVDATIDRAVAAWAKVKTVRGTFEQTVTNPLTGTSATARGDYAQERPNRLSIRFKPPATDAIVADGKAVWIYLPSSAPGQVIKRPAADRDAVPIDLTGQFLDAPRAKYDITAAGPRTIDGHAAHGLTLVPKKGSDAPFTKATVWIDDDDSLIREFEETESSGVVRHVHLTSLEPNADHRSRRVHLHRPQGREGRRSDEALGQLSACASRTARSSKACCVVAPRTMLQRSRDRRVVVQPARELRPFAEHVPRDLVAEQPVEPRRPRRASPYPP